METFKPPAFELAPGSASVMLYARVAVEVVQANGTVTKLFFVSLVRIYFYQLLFFLIIYQKKNAIFFTCFAILMKLIS